MIKEDEELKKMKSQPPFRVLDIVEQYREYSLNALVSRTELSDLRRMGRFI